MTAGTDDRSVNNNSFTEGGVNPTFGGGGSKSTSYYRGHSGRNYSYELPNTVVHVNSTPDVIVVGNSPNYSYSYGRRGAHTNCLTVALFILIVGFGIAKASPEIAGRIVVITLVTAFAVIGACVRRHLRLD